MAAPDKKSRTEKPTAKRLSEAKSKGSVPRSAEFTNTVMLLVAFVSLNTFGPGMLRKMQGAFGEYFSQIGTLQISEANIYVLFLKTMLLLGVVLLPLFSVMLLVGLLTSHVQEPISFSFARMKMGVDKLNPVNGFGRLFNKDAAVEGGKSVLKIILISYIAYRVLRDEMDAIVFLVHGDLGSIVSYLGHITFKVVLNCCGTLFLLAVIDLAYVKWRFIDNLKMTKDEIKEEHKQMEGDPKVKGKIRQVQFAQARRRMHKIIPTADVVITNPTHYAVAIKYDREKMAAPVVIAKAVDAMAQQIKLIAKDNRVMLVENRLLARELYAEVDEGKEIPEKFYAAVAEVLAYVYSLRGKI
jgi:flagellar biosynthetic protein FlhB